MAAGSSAATLGVPNSPGVSENTARDTLVLKYNDVAGLEAAMTGTARRSPPLLSSRLSATWAASWGPLSFIGHCGN